MHKKNECGFFCIQKRRKVGHTAGSLRRMQSFVISFKVTYIQMLLRLLLQIGSGEF